MTWTYEARGVAVHDGRTARLRLTFPPTGLSLELDVVLAGIDVPEMIGPEAEHGRRAQQALHGLIVGKDVLQVSLTASVVPGRAPEAAIAFAIALQDGAEFVDVAGRMIALGCAREPTAVREPWA